MKMTSMLQLLYTESHFMISNYFTAPIDRMKSCYDCCIIKIHICHNTDTAYIGIIVL